MANDVATHVTRCPSCQHMKPSLSKPRGLLQPLEIPMFPWQSISTDFITCLPQTAQGNDTLAVWVDRLTKYVIVQPCKLTITGPDFAQMTIDHVISKHGIPESIVSDQDVRFKSAFSKQLNKIYNCQLKMSSAFHPQTDGQTERMRHYVCFAQDDWDKQIQMVAFAINNAQNASTKQTPFFLNKG